MKEDFLCVVVNFLQSLQNQRGNKTITAETLKILDEDSSQQLDSSTQKMILFSHFKISDLPSICGQGSLYTIQFVHYFEKLPGGLECGN